jgi:hypothetical protein
MIHGLDTGFLVAADFHRNGFAAIGRTFPDAARFRPARIMALSRRLPPSLFTSA